MDQADAEADNGHAADTPDDAADAAVAYLDDDFVVDAWDDLDGDCAWVEDGVRFVAFQRGSGEDGGRVGMGVVGAVCGRGACCWVGRRGCLRSGWRVMSSPWRSRMEGRWKRC